MYKNLRDIAAHKKGLWSKVVVSKKFFFSCRLLRFVAGIVLFLYFKKVVAAIHSSMDTVLFRRALAAMNCVHTIYLTDIWKVLRYIRNSSCSHAFDEWPFFHYKRTVVAVYSFKSTVFLQNKSCSKKMSELLIISLWFQKCIYWKKSIILLHQSQLSVFSMVVTLFHGSTWSGPYVKDTVFISQHL